MRIRRIQHALLLAVTLGTTPQVRADDFPKELVTWTPLEGNPVFKGTGGDTWDRKVRERGFILREDGTFHLWYTGYNDDRSPEKYLGHATSSDGLKWDRDPANPIFNKSWTEDVFVVRHQGRYLMVAEGRNDIAHQLTSADRLHWDDLGSLDVRKVDGSPIPPGPYGTPTLWNEGGEWFLFYERSDQGVWLAKSTDRKVWTNVS